jgi:hypothetical protein
MSNNTQKNYADTIGISRVSISDSHKVTLPILKAGGVVCWHGEAGIGKTAGAGQIADALGAVLVANTVSHMQAADFGIPYRDPTDKEFFQMLLPPWTKKIFEAQKAGKPTLVFFDEITRYQDAETASGLFNFISERSIYGVDLPEDCYIMAACNPDNGAYQVNDILNDPAWRRRLCHMEVTTDVSGWLAYAREKEYHKWVIDYVSSNLEKLLDEKARAAGKIYATPASWEKVSRFLKVNDDLLNPVAISTYVGYQTASDFVNFTQDSEFKLSPRAVLTDWPTTVGTLKRIEQAGRKDLITRVVTSTMLYIYGTKPNPEEIVANLCRFWAHIDDDVKVKMCTELWSRNDGTDNYYKLLISALKPNVLWKTKIFPVVSHCLN